MTRPTSHLDWYPDVVNTLAIRAGWIGALWHYTLEWGDGTKQRVLAWQPLVHHVYAKPDQYTLRATAELRDPPPPITLDVVVRPGKSPQGELVDLGRGKVRLSLTGWDPPVLNRIVWGDGTPAEEYSGTQLTPEHQYAPGTTAPRIVVTDVPARRVGRWTGPTVPPETTGTPRFGWHPDKFQKEPPDGPGAITFAYGQVLGAGVPAGTRVALRMYWSENDSETVHATADTAGNVTFPAVKWVAGSAEFYCPFRTAKAWFPDNPDQPVVWIPCVMRADEAQPVIPMYTFDLDNPSRITLGVANPKAGWYQVNWGDGSDVEEHECDGRALAVAHTYSRRSRMTITVADPDGNVGTREIAAPEFHKPWVQQTEQQWTRVGAAISVLNGADWYCPIHVDWSYDNPTDALPHLRHPTHADRNQQNVAHGWYQAERGKTLTIRVYGPLRPPLEHTMKIPDYYARGAIENDPPGVTKKSVSDPPAQQLQAGFARGTSWHGGYSGQFRVHNDSTGPVPGWRLEFALPADARIADVWGPHVRLLDLGGGRHAITCPAELRNGVSVLPGIRVENTGQPPTEPAEIRATATRR